ncbi:MAG: NAD(P)/FAD-dependent oxidoreductase [Phaeodactylibacter sp.]|uniref:NAD(P)/FAD-dependent oxidoreductase n=1 Tax=Phaeodactylibacter sp. TaxID=1940289 RepID=UPI0032EFBA59
MKTSADIIIIGGGPSGSSTATHLSKMGYDVLVLEKAHFPREHVGESMLPFTYDLFEELGVLEDMKARFTRKPGVTFSNADASQESHWCFNRVIDGPQALSFHARRAQFDDLLLRNSEQNGATVIEGAAVTDMHFEDQGVKVIAEVDHGEPQTFTARFLVDASGQNAFIARKMGMQKPFKRLNVRQALSAHWVNVKLDDSLANGNIKIVHLGGEKLGWIWMIPIKDSLSIGVALNMSYAKQERKRLMAEHGRKGWEKALYLQEIQSSAAVMNVLQGAEMIDEVASNGDFSYYSEKKFDDQYAIVGDAGGFLDPIFSSGIYLGMMGAKLAAKGIDDLLQGRGKDRLEAAYQDISGGYQVVEELICTFYEPNSIAFSDITVDTNFSFRKFETAYSILHLILAGDFFTNHERYLKAIATLKSADMIEKFKSLTGHAEEAKMHEVCLMPA